MFAAGRLRHPKQGAVFQRLPPVELYWDHLSSNDSFPKISGLQQSTIMCVSRSSYWSPNESILFIHWCHQNNQIKTCKDKVYCFKDCAPPLVHFIARFEPLAAANAEGNCYSWPNFPMKCGISSSEVEKCLLTVSSQVHLVSINNIVNELVYTLNR